MQSEGHLTGRWEDLCKTNTVTHTAKMASHMRGMCKWWVGTGSQNGKWEHMFESSIMHALSSGPQAAVLRGFRGLTSLFQPVSVSIQRRRTTRRLDT